MVHTADFLPDDLIADVDLTPWADILPKEHRVLKANLFGDMFLAGAEGSVHMLDVGVGTVTKIATTEEEFRLFCLIDEDGWLLRPLIGSCREAGMHLSKGQCYAFTTLPLFGGQYEPDNVWVCSWRDWISFTASIYSQTKELPDGATVSLRIID